jgi:hypothetical protein
VRFQSVEQFSLVQRAARAQGFASWNAYVVHVSETAAKRALRRRISRGTHG